MSQENVEIVRRRATTLCNRRRSRRHSWRLDPTIDVESPIPDAEPSAAIDGRDAIGATSGVAARASPTSSSTSTSIRDARRLRRRCSVSCSGEGSEQRRSSIELA